MKYEIYEVGGHVRDQLLGIPSKDIDYTVVVEDKYRQQDPLTVYWLLVDDLEQKGFDVFLKTPDCFTIRAKFPQSKEVADFVLARRETEYIEGTRQPRVVLGTLTDDLTRRDFTVNAMARNRDTKEFVDLFGGQKDLQDKILRTPVDASIAFKDDPLRILRALRFAITKEFSLSEEIIDAIKRFTPDGIKKVSLERIREELHKMFYHDTFETFAILTQLNSWNPFLFYLLFRGKQMWLMPTMKK